MERLVFKNDEFEVTKMGGKGYVVSDLFNGENVGESELLEKRDLNSYLRNNGFRELEDKDFYQLPKCELCGQDGNVFNLMGIVSRTLISAGQRANSEYMVKAVTKCKSYDEALQTFMHYVDVR